MKKWIKRLIFVPIVAVLLSTNVFADTYTSDEQDYMIRLAMCEDGANADDINDDGLRDGMVAINQAVKNFCNENECTISDAIVLLRLSVYDREFSQDEYDAACVAFDAVWNCGTTVTDKNIMWWITPEAYDGSFHSTMKFAGKFGSHYFVYQ